MSIDYRYKERGIEDGIVKHFEFQEGKKINATSFWMVAHYYQDTVQAENQNSKAQHYWNKKVWFQEIE